MAKVLISFLGTGPSYNKNREEARRYQEAIYRLGEREIGSYRFMSAALSDYYKIDKTILIGTPHSMWEEVYHWYAHKNNISFDDEAWGKIWEYCSAANETSPIDTIPHQDKVEEALGDGSHVVLIRYGLNDEEIRENLNIVLGIDEYLEKGDELIVDITHSFRSLPLLLMNLLIYLQNVSSKKLHISHVHYGMVDVAKTMGYAPIVDLVQLLEMSKWTQAAYAFQEYGNAHQVADLIEGENKSVAKTLRNFSGMMNLNHLGGIQSGMQALNNTRNKKYSTRIPNLIIDPITESFTRRFGGQRINNSHAAFQFELAKWQFEHHNYASAYMSLVESIITYVGEKNPDVITNVHDEDMRTEVKKALRHRTDRNHRIKYDDEVSKIFKKVNATRNSLTHTIATDRNVEDMTRILRDSIDKLSSIINQ